MARPDLRGLCLGVAGADFGDFLWAPVTFHGHKRHGSEMYGRFANFLAAWNIFSTAVKPVVHAGPHGGCNDVKGLR